MLRILSICVTLCLVGFSSSQLYQLCAKFGGNCVYGNQCPNGYEYVTRTTSLLYCPPNNVCCRRQTSTNQNQYPYQYPTVPPTGYPWQYPTSAPTQYPNLYPTLFPNFPNNPYNPYNQNYPYTYENEKCGFDINPAARILNGNRSPKCAWPWMVSFRYSVDGSSRKHICGGVLFKRDRVLTSASCLTPISSLTSNSRISYDLVLGENDRRIIEDTEEFIPIDSRNVVTHPNYNAQTQANDIAIVKLPRQIDYKDCRLPVCLPSKQMTPTLPFNYNNRDPVYPQQYQIPNIPGYGCSTYAAQRSGCVMAGWGVVNETDPVFFPTLQDMKANVFNRETCRAMMRYIDNTMIPENSICADSMNPNQKTCLGDHGGMLICPEDGRWVLTGIIAVPNCLRKGPTVLTDVEAMFPWIQSVR